MQLSPDTTLDFVETGGESHQQHYAFLVTETEFDEIFTASRSANWAVRSERSWDINDWDDGRGVYFDHPNGPFARNPPVEPKGLRSTGLTPDRGRTEIAVSIPPAEAACRRQLSGANSVLNHLSTQPIARS